MNGPAVTGGARDGLTGRGRGATTHAHRPQNTNCSGAARTFCETIVA